jgi:hypothetical protein
MKHQAIHFVGLDVHQSTVVACVRDESGRVVMKATVPTEEKDIVALVRSGRARARGLRGRNASPVAARPAAAARRTGDGVQRARSQRDNE